MGSLLGHGREIAWLHNDGNGVLWPQHACEAARGNVELQWLVWESSRVSSQFSPQSTWVAFLFFNKWPYMRIATILECFYQLKDCGAQSPFKQVCRSMACALHWEFWEWPVLGSAQMGQGGTQLSLIYTPCHSPWVAPWQNTFFKKRSVVYGEKRISLPRMLLSAAAELMSGLWPCPLGHVVCLL